MTSQPDETPGVRDAAAQPVKEGGSVRGSRRLARELALKALYQWLLNPSPVSALLEFCTQEKEFVRADEQHLRALLEGVTSRAEELRGDIAPYLDRAVTALSPVEHAILLLGAMELKAFADVPYRVVINEGVELAKLYGGTDGYKYVNGVLDKLAAQLRPLEARSKA